MSNHPKVLLLTPPYHSGVVESAGVWLNLGLLYLAGSLREAGYEVIYYDAMSHWHDYDTIAQRMREEKADVVATTAFTAEIVDALQVLRLAKEIDPRVITVIGNVHPTFCYDEILREHHSYLDYIVRGEGERTLVELLAAHFAAAELSTVRGLAYWRDEAAVVTPTREFIKDLDLLTPAWDLVDWPIYTYKPMVGSTLAIVSSSRGCSQRCSFCSQQLFWKRRWRARSPENFVAEIEDLKNRFGVNVVMLADETPTVSKTRWEAILDLLIERNLGTKILMETRVDDVLRDRDILGKYRDAGVDHIYVGVEATSQSTLDIFKKDIKVEQSREAIQLINAYDIVSETSFVMGMPDETRESMRETVELAKYYAPDMAFFLAIAPWPYAELYPELKDHIEEYDYRKYNLVEPVVKPRGMTLAEVSEEIGRASREFYMYQMSRLDEMSDRKREFMVKVMHILATSSYLAETMQGDMPAEVRRLLAGLEQSEHPHTAVPHPPSKE